MHIVCLPASLPFYPNLVLSLPALSLAVFGSAVSSTGWHILLQVSHPGISLASPTANAVLHTRLHVGHRQVCYGHPAGTSTFLPYAQACLLYARVTATDSACHFVIT